MGFGSEQARKTRTVQRGWWLAMTGLYANWREVEARLLALGHPDAPRWLGSPELRAAMDRVCLKSIAARERWRAELPELLRFPDGSGARPEPGIKPGTGP